MRSAIRPALAVMLSAIAGTAAGVEARLITYNIRYDNPADAANAWPHRKDAVAALLRRHAPDVFGLQEALPHQIAELSAALPEYGWLGVGRDAGGGGEGTPVFYRKERFTLVQSGTFWLSETPDRPSRGWDAALNRICSHGLFEEKQSRKRLWLVNCHFDHAGQTAGVESARLVLSFAGRINADNHPLLLLGDFNAEPDSLPIALLKKSMADSRDISRSRPVGPSGTFSGFAVGKTATRRIDYVFSAGTGDLHVLGHAVLDDAEKGHYPSDHLPVSVRIAF